jgi:predicted GIY-YIG superfamily endonuclease
VGRVERQSQTPIERNGWSTVDDDGIVVGMAWVYIRRCTDGSLYVGHTDDVATRELVHKTGHGSRFTAKRLPVRVVYWQECGSLKSVISRERQLKRWTARKQEALIAGDFSTLKVRSRRRGW